MRPTPQGRSARRKGAAVGLSAMGHLAFLALILGSASGGVVPGGGSLATGSGVAGDGPMTVSLVDPGTVSSPAPTEPSVANAREAVADLFRRVAIVQAPEATAPTKPVERVSLDQLLGKSGADKAQGDVRDSRPSGGQPEGARQDGPSRNQAMASNGSLWGQIEPCWRQQPGVSRALVRLELTLGADGRLAMPPKIIRTSEMTLDERQFFAEARALNALRTCLPLRRGGAVGVQQIEFRPGQ